MQRKQITDGGSLAVGTFALFALVVPNLLKLVGLVEWAQGLSDVFALFSDPRISWNGIYLFLAISAASVALVNNWADLVEWRKKLSAKHVHIWNYSAQDAIRYISYDSSFGDTITKGDKFMDAAMALIAAAEQGKLHIGGRKPGQYYVSEIPISTLGGGEIRPHLQPDKFGHPELIDIAIHNNSGDLLYSGIMANYSEVRSAFPK